MKYIIKGSEPQELTDFKALATAEWTPEYSNLDKPVKKAMKTALMKEQGYICCYCERTLTEDDSHIEHFKPQSDTDVDSLDFSNMLCSCQKNVKKGTPLHCGNSKGDWFDDALLVSPLQANCASKFGFKGDGTIYAVDNDVSALTTIDKLDLDIEKLNSLRKSAIEPFLDDSLTDEEVSAFIEGYLSKSGAGKYEPFQTTIQYLFSEMVA